MNNTWLTEDHRIHLPKLFEYLGYTRTICEPTHCIYTRSNLTCVVVRTDTGFLYYTVQRPEKKLSVSHLIIAHVSSIEGASKETIWDKVHAFYQKVLKIDDLLIGTKELELQTVSKDFNHFGSYSQPLSQKGNGVYKEISTMSPFLKRVFENREGSLLFPLFNLQNENCGFFVDGEKGVSPYGESSIKNSLWYSVIPDRIDWLVVFKDPKEALAFHGKFRLKNVVYLALGAITYETTKILFQVQKSTKVKKIILSFTGGKKIEGYLRDLNFFAFMDPSNFHLTVRERDIKVGFHMGEEKAFLNFFNSTKAFNQGLAKSYRKYNNILDQNRINEQSIMIAKEEKRIMVRVPLEVNAIKFFVWSYYKNYLNKSIDILKPVQPNWHLERESTQSIPLKGEEVHWKDYRIAL